MELAEAELVAQQIANGHAYSKHVLRGHEFPEIRTRQQFRDLVVQVLTDPTSEVRGLQSGRRAFWSDRHQTLVILDPLSEDGGTAYRPVGARNYFRFLR